MPNHEEKRTETTRDELLASGGILTKDQSQTFLDRLLSNLENLKVMSGMESLK